MRYLKFVLFLIFNFSFIYATIYKDIKNKTPVQWQFVKSNDISSAKSAKNKSRKSRVIEFEGTGTKEIYALYTSENKEGHEYWVSWDMKFSEDFVIILQIQSNLGKHYLIYTPGTLNSYMQYGLGRGTTNGRWRTFRRNIQKDIAYFDNRVKIVSLKRFVVKGSGTIRNIRTLLGSPRDRFNERIKKPIDEKKLSTEKRERSFLKISKSSSPFIKMRGQKIVKLKLGEPYIEKGVFAYDKEDGEIDVVTIENVYINKLGRYMILYMATDSDGNVAMDKRYVDVGDVINKKANIHRSEDKEDEISPLQPSIAQKITNNQKMKEEKEGIKFAVPNYFSDR